VSSAGRQDRGANNPARYWRNPRRCAKCENRSSNRAAYPSNGIPTQNLIPRTTASGNGNTNSVGLTYTSHFKACVSVPSWPDNCSSWVRG
jgi:hypothetical protein